METALPLLLFLACLFGLALLILICGMQSKELERTEEVARALTSQDLLGTSRFFATSNYFGLEEPAVLADDSVLARVEHYLREQESVADQFVEQPSVERLHSRSLGELLSCDALFERIEQHLKREHRLAAQFVADPSVERLFGLTAAA